MIETKEDDEAEVMYWPKHNNFSETWLPCTHQYTGYARWQAHESKKEVLAGRNFFKDALSAVVDFRNWKIFSSNGTKPSDEEDFDVPNFERQHAILVSLGQSQGLNEEEIAASIVDERKMRSEKYWSGTQAQQYRDIEEAIRRAGFTVEGIRSIMDFFMEKKDEVSQAGNDRQKNRSVFIKKRNVSSALHGGIDEMIDRILEQLFAMGYVRNDFHS